MKGFYINLVLTVALCFGGFSAAKCCAEWVTVVYEGTVECLAGIQTCNYNAGQTCPENETCKFGEKSEIRGDTIVWTCKCRP
jgi:hypothetical protein